MVPHLEVGNRVATSKFAYGFSRYSLPLHLGAFVSASEHRNGALWINGLRAPTQDAHMIVRLPHDGEPERAQLYEEALPGGYAHAVQNLTDVGALNNFGPYVVPAGFIFFMGDNRDNSLDRSKI
jgi:signal peptidase I